MDNAPTRGFSMSDLARILEVSRSTVHASVRHGATMEWVVRTLTVLELHGWPAAEMVVRDGVMSVRLRVDTVPASV